MATKTREKKASEGKVNALQKPLQLSEELAAVMCKLASSRSSVANCR
jgi:DNA-binding FrmR family transcriptional regulator